MAKLTITEPELLSERYLSDEHIRCIGLVAAEWSLLELNLRWEIAVILGLRDGAKSAVAVTTGASANGLAQAIRNLLDLSYLVEEQAAPLRLAMARVDRMTPLRNEIVHAAWLAEMLPAGSSGVFVPTQAIATGTYAGGRGRTIKMLELTAGQIRQVAIDIQEIRIAISHKREPAPSPALADWDAREEMRRTRPLPMSHGGKPGGKGKT